MIYKDIAWKYYHGALLPQTAPHIKIELTKKEEQELLKLSKAYFLRYVSDWDKEEESQFWYVIKDEFGGIEELSSNTRSKVRRGLKHCIVKKVSHEIIANEGYEVYRQAFKNYDTYIEPTDKETFIKTILASSKCDFWAVYKKDEDKMIAYSQNFIEENSVNYSTIKFHPEYLKLYPSYALFFEMNKYYLEEKNFLYVNDGARSISHDTNIQDFLVQKFKFRKAYCKLHIVYRWDIGLAVKVLYLLKSFRPKVNSKIFNKISVLLNQEEIRRSFEK